MSALSFNYPCSQIALPLCPLVQAPEPVCYSRNIEISGQLIFEPATLVVNVIALFMTAIMIYQIKQKYTAVGRKEIVIFFYMFALSQVFEFLLLSGLIPTSNVAYSYMVAIYDGIIISTIWCLLLNGFVGFQWAEDGTPLSLWSIRISSLVIFLVTFFINIATFLQIAGFTASFSLPLFVIHYVFGAAMIVIYMIGGRSASFSINSGDILFGFSFFIIAKIFELVLSPLICSSAKHYIDGMFFGTTFTLLAVMMVYKYWDSITREDLEFSVGGKSNVWELKNPLLSGEGDE